MVSSFIWLFVSSHKLWTNKAFFCSQCPPFILTSHGLGMWFQRPLAYRPELNIFSGWGMTTLSANHSSCLVFTNALDTWQGVDIHKVLNGWPTFFWNHMLRPWLWGCHNCDSTVAYSNPADTTMPAALSKFRTAGGSAWIWSSSCHVNFRFFQISSKFPNFQPVTESNGCKL